VNDEEALEDDAGAGEVSAEQKEAQVGTHERDRLDDREGDPNTRARHQVVGKRVAEEAIDDAQNEHQCSHEPVELARLAERTGKEHPGHVHCDGAEEDIGCPVVGLAHQQSGAHVEREIDG